ncbi:hypothetical protein QOZ80_6BG0493490 [Eleusine coracana subsp. coracana]|nr:hypothetical protein QOZ80_6BG0493490 [Eleusine coracana subsp. coracana]
MGYHDAPGDGGGRKLSLASVGFAGAGAGMGGSGGGSYKDLLVMALPRDDGLDGDKVADIIGVKLPDVGGTVRSILGRREVREFASGALAGAMSKAILAPLETIRTRMVVGVGSRHILGSFVEIIEQNGWQGLWAGNTINMVRIIPTQAIELATFECVKRSMAEAQANWKENGYPKIQLGNLEIELPLHFLSPIAIAGGAAGIAATLMCHPLEVIKDRLTVDRKTYPSISLAFSKIYQTDGIRGLYAGLFPTLIGMVPYTTCHFFMYDTMKTSYCRLHKKSSLTRPELLVIGALSGLTASTISFPLEVARKRLMVGALQGKCPPNMIAALSEVIQEEGLMGLYRGWGASCLKVMPNSGITWMLYEAWKDILLADKDKQPA